MTLNDALLERPSRRGAPAWLVALAVLETLSLVVLVTNRLTLDLRPLAAALGPVHGAFYLAIVLGAVLLRLGTRSVLLALVPVVGGLLVVRAARRGG